MNKEEILELIKAVSASNVTAFRYKDNEVSLELECDRVIKTEIITTGSVPTVEIPDAEKDENLLIIKSPMVGTFYSAKSEKSEPFVQVGDRVKKGQTVGIIEAMKLMNEIESEFDGIVERIEVSNKGMVEYGQTLICLKPL